MPGGRSLRKTAAGLWLPATTAKPASKFVPTRVFAPHDVVFPGLPNDFGEFKRLVRSLSRTDTLLWCARMNLHLGHPLQDDPTDVQKHFVASFFTGEEVANLNRFVREHGEDISVFFRGQLLELMRWVALLSTDQSEDGTTFDDPAVRQRFARAALLAGDVWGRCRRARESAGIEGRRVVGRRQRDRETIAWTAKE